MQFVIPIIAIVVGVVFFVQSFSFPHMAADPGGPALFPQVIAAATVLGGMAILVQLFWERSYSVAVSPQAEASAKPWYRNYQALAMYGLVVVLPIGIDLIGFNAFLFVFMAVGLRLSGIGTLKSVLISAVSTPVIYFLYSKVLGAVLPSGLLFS